MYKRQGQDGSSDHVGIVEKVENGRVYTCLLYTSMTAEQFIWAWLRSEMLEPKEIKFEDGNYYYAALKDVIEGRPVRKQPKEPKQFHKRKEATHD